MNKISRAFGTVVLFLSVTFAIAQPLLPTQIDSLIDKTMSKMPLAGTAVLVVKDGKVVHMRGYGMTSAASKAKVDENTLFSIASNTKAFTAMALAILVDEKKLNWQDNVVDYIPEFKMYNPYVTANFNIQDLLTHRSGLGLGAGDLLFIPDGSNFTIKDVLKSFQYQEPVSGFRTKYDYDNLLYEVAGEVISRVSGMRYADFFESRIMKPLGMTSSVVTFQRVKNNKNVAMPHSSYANELKEFKPYVENETLGAAGGIWASVNDLSKWVLLHLNGGKYGENLRSTLVSQANHNEMWKPHTLVNFNGKPGGPAKTHFVTYGLGWGISDLNGYVVYSHTGGMPGMLSKTTLLPELNLGVVVLTNTEPGGYAFQSISNAIVDSYVGVKIDRISQMAQRLQTNQNAGDSVTTAVWNTVKKAKPINLNLQSFTGTYHDNWFGDVTITLKEGSLWFTSLRSPKLTGKMFFYKGNTFAVKWDYQDMNCDAFATFSLDEEGIANGIKMRGISPNIDFSFDFQDLDFTRVK
jgi:CubicO group peptidase (beta-lactamase class C family)